MITRIETSPSEARDVYVTVANFSNSHVFRSLDAGSTWTDIDNGGLPDMPHHAVLIRPVAPKELFLCSDAGVFVTEDAGTTWKNVTLNLPKILFVIQRLCAIR